MRAGFRRRGLGLYLALTCMAAVAAPELQWQDLAPMPVGVQEIYPTVHGGRIVVAGGLSSELPAASGHLSNALQVYDPATQRWSLGTPLPEGRHHGQLLSHGDTLYLIGGFVRCAQGDWCASRDVLTLRDGSTRWERQAPLPRPLTESTAFVLKGQLHLVGGRSPKGEANAQWGDHDDVDWHWVLDLGAAQRTWRELPPVSQRKSSAAAAVLKGQAYVLGGRSHKGGNLREVHRFDTSTGQWQTEALLAFPQAAHGVAAVGDRLLCSVGGEFANPDGSEGVLSEVQCMDLNDKRWRVRSTLPEPRHGLGVVSLDGHLYALGGARQPGLKQTSARVERLSLR